MQRIAGTQVEKTPTERYKTVRMSTFPLKNICHVFLSAAVEMDIEEDKGKSASRDVPASGMECSKSEHRSEKNSNLGKGMGSGDSVKSDSSDGVKVSHHSECDTTGVKSLSVESEGVRCDEGGGGGGGARSEQERKLWDAVTANSSDFNSWTSLLQLVEQHVC